jgi:5-methylphenazine-1-carboxylate 1-monooxygenase
MQVLIVGAGIGGLATALSCHAAGIACKVFEAAPEIQPLGVGINVLPHSVRELDALGLLPILEQTGILTRELTYYTKRGQHIYAEPRGRFAGYQWPQISIHRGHLQRVLLEAVIARIGRENVRTDHTLVSFTQDLDETAPQVFPERTRERPPWGIAASAKGTIPARSTDATCRSKPQEAKKVYAKFTNTCGAEMGTYSGDLLLACDGIHSVVRKHFYPDEGAPQWSGVMLWRGTVEAPPYLTGASMLMMGHAKCKMVMYPIANLEKDGSRQLINWVADVAAPENWIKKSEDWNRRGKLEDVLNFFDGWNFEGTQLTSIIESTKTIYEYPMSDRDPIDRWVFGRVALMGDAAHPMYPIGSNGSSQAILDARVLIHKICAAGIDEGLRQYEAERAPATAQLIRLNRQEGPDKVLQVVEERAPEGFKTLADAISDQEIAEISMGYKKTAGFAISTLHAKPSLDCTFTS